MTMSIFRAPRVRLPLFLAIILAGCGGGSGVDTTVSATSVAPTAIATPAPSPSATATDTMVATMPMPAASAVAAPSVAGLDPIASGLNAQDYLQKAGGNGAIPPSGLPDAVGAFRFTCLPSHNAYDDPIVYPGQPGKSHLHTFFGNTKTDANSTYRSLRTTGDSTCSSVLNRSAYWIPALMNGHGKVVMPKFISIYYKRRPSTDPVCKTQAENGCIALPRGLRYVFGYNMALTPEQNKAANNLHFSFRCIRSDNTSTATFDNIKDLIPLCKQGDLLSVGISAPDCWDGTRLDSPDHREHVGYGTFGNLNGYVCPAAYKYVIPQFTLGAHYPFDPDTAADWYFSSDRMPGMTAMTSGTTFHADWFGAWEDSVIDAWSSNCIEKLLNCSAGDLGNGWQMKDLTASMSMPTMVDVPPKG